MTQKRLCVALEELASALPRPHDRTLTALGRTTGLLMLLLMISVVADAQPWSGIVSPSRATNWSSPGVVGGIPTRTTICATLNPGATASQINSAISACPSGQVVFLNAGTYTLSSGITFGSKNNVTLRGAGAHLTKLNFTGQSGCSGLASVVCIGASGNYDSPAQTANWTAGYAAGTTAITLSSVSNLQVGDLLGLDQLDDSTDGGAVFVCATSSCSDEGGNSPGRSNRGQQQNVRVTAINGTTVTIDPPLRMPNWRSSQSPGAFWYGVRPRTGDGVEDLSLNAASASGANGVVFLGAMNSWVKGIRSMRTDRSHIWFYHAARITVRDSYFYGSQGTGSQSYGIEPFGGGDHLVENNMFQHVTAPVTINGSSTGSVYGYNFSIDNNFTGNGGSAPGWMLGSIIFHEVGISHELFEGNDGLGVLHDDIHGTTHFNTFFRNHFYGDIFNSPPKNSNTDLIHIQSYGRFFNIVGNVLGRTGYYQTYEPSGATGGGARYIYTLGDSPESAVPNDPQTKATLMRWGNYDTVTGTNRFLAAEVPSGLSQFPNPLPATQSLPASFYLPGKPSWFGASPWPAIGPDVTGGPHTAGRAHKIPARQCWEQTAIDPAFVATSVRLFNASACYVGGTTGNPPGAPNNLRVTE